MSMRPGSKQFFSHGSRWLRADFHLHTRADKGFSHAGDANDFHADYIDALKAAEIGVGVITNHNKFARAEFVALRKRAWKQGIFLLPGVELSVGDGANGIHTLIVFSDEWLADGHNRIQQFLQIAFAGQAPGQYENWNGRCSLGLIETIKKLEDFHKEFFLVFAHVEDRGGLWHELGGGRLGELGEDERFRRRCLAFQKVRTHDVPDRVCRAKVRGWLDSAYPAEVEGSDAKAIDQVGRGRSCYLKIGDFTFDAVRYALLDHAHRVAPEPPGHRHSHILSISFEGGVLQGTTIHLSPGLNTVIGIRGSGKSSILEAIRYAINIPFGDRAQDKEYKQHLVDHVLGGGGKVTLQAIDRRGQEYEIRRINRETPDVYIDGVLQPGVSIRETVLHKPIYFGQKDLSAAGEGFEKDLVEKLVGEKVAEIRLRIEAQRQKIREVVGRLTGLSNTEEKKTEYEDQRRDAEFRLEFFRNHGVEEKLQKQVDFDADSRKCSQMVAFSRNYLEALEEFVTQYEDDLKNHRVYTSKQNRDFFDEFFDVYDGLIASFMKVKEAFTAGKQAWIGLKKKAKDFEQRKESLKEEFADIERNLAKQLKESGARAIRSDEFRELRKTVDSAAQMLEALDRDESKRTSLHRELVRELAVLNELWRQEYRVIGDELKIVNQGHTSLEIKAEFKGDKTAFAAFMKELFRGSRIRQAKFSALAKEFPDFGAMYRRLEEAKRIVGDASARVFEQLFTDNLAALLTWQIPNRFLIEYRGKDLQRHSLGQRASALLLFVLGRRENDLFMIDQPEDDLDNQTICQDVIELLRILKRKTQFIFVTHNANFPVLGDAEQVISCSYSDDSVGVTTGSIDRPELQQRVVGIMEGGEEAFRQRRRRYETWKPRNS